MSDFKCPNCNSRLINAGPDFIVWKNLLEAALAGGASPSKAVEIADIALAAIRQRREVIFEELTQVRLDELSKRK